MSHAERQTACGAQIYAAVSHREYFADFACRAHNLVIEIDGSQHLTRETYDRTRDEYLLRAGYSVFRVPPASVFSNRDGICDSLLAVLEGRMEDDVDGFDLRFHVSDAASVRRGFSSRNAKRRLSAL